METICEHCKKPLVVIGRKRKNGVKHHDDWKDRKFHKKCYVEFINNAILFEYVLNIANK